MQNVSDNVRLDGKHESKVIRPSRVTALKWFTGEIIEMMGRK
jgi:hypothetical protein